MDDRRKKINRIVVIIDLLVFAAALICVILGETNSNMFVSSIGRTVFLFWLPIGNLINYKYGLFKADKQNGKQASIGLIVVIAMIYIAFGVLMFIFRGNNDFAIFFSSATILISIGWLGKAIYDYVKIKKGEDPEEQTADDEDDEE